MTRQSAPGDFQLDVDNVGQFTFGRRSARDVFRIRGEYAQLTGGNYDADGYQRDVVALAYATLKVLTVVYPADFSLDKLDPLLSDSWEERLMMAFTALRTKELSFRPPSGEAGEAKGEGDVLNVRVSVSPPVLATAN
jgi:hypothetical protein